MLLIFVVFVAVFAIAALLVAAATQSSASKKAHIALASALRLTKLAPAEEIIDVRKEHRLSAIPWLHRLLSRLDLAHRTRLLLAQADLNWTSGKLILYCVGLFVAVAYVANRKFHLPGPGFVLALIAGTMPLTYVWLKRGKRLRTFQQKLPEALDLMVSALRAGHSLAGALGAASREAPEPVGREFRICFEEQNFGVDLRTACTNLLTRVPLPDLRIVTTAMLIHRDTGGNVAEVLEKSGHVIRERFRIRQQIKVHTAQGRLTGVVLMLLPVAVATIIYFGNPAYIGLLFSRDLGHKMLMGAAVMNFIGFLIIRSVVNIKV